MKPAKVELISRDGAHQLLVDGAPFYLKGAGLEFGNMHSLALHGGNCFRTWRVNNGVLTGLEVLDQAHELGLMVCMGLELGRERRGFDYDDTNAIEQQFESVKKDVLALKDHPALLMWGIGNELNLHYTNPKVWDAVNDIAAMIHREDPNHPTTTMLAGADKDDIKQVAERCPEIDLLSLQLYGEIENVAKYIDASGYTGAYIVSEWGATGHWEIDCTSWGQPIEQTSHEKASAVGERYSKYIAAGPANCIGSFVFLWGQKQERTPTWYGIFLEDGQKTEPVDVMQYVWTGSWPKNRAPVIQSMKIGNREASDSIYLEAGKTYRASSKIINSENYATLDYSWVIMREVGAAIRSEGGDFEPSPEIMRIIEGGGTDSKISFQAPQQGEYRLFCYASDPLAGAATANIPFMVE